MYDNDNRELMNEIYNKAQFKYEVSCNEKVAEEFKQSEKNDNYNKYESHLKTVYIVLGILAILSYFLVL